MRVKSVDTTAEAPDEAGIATLARLAGESFEIVARDLRDRIAALETQLMRYGTAIGNISQGVCLFDRDERLILSNPRYAEIYRLTPDQVCPGTSLRDIADHRVAAGTSVMDGEAYVALSRTINAGDAPRTWTAELADGRSIHICHQAMPDGSWVATHEDITELKTTRAVVEERVSLQALIDWMPEYLWIKDTSGRFIIANKAIAADNGLADSRDMIGLTDFDLHMPDAARAFHAREQTIIRSGQPMIGFEEAVVDSMGRTRWYLSTKAPMHKEGGEIFGLIGIGRDITTYKRAEELRNGQSHILRMIATNASLEEVLTQLMHLVEAQLDGIFGSVLILDNDGQHLRHGAAPSLAADYTQAINGFAIGPKAGSCGTAAFRREAVMVSDIMADRLWEDYRHLAAAHGYRSCWSTPILSHHGDVLGLFAMYSGTVRTPTDAETALTEETIRLAGIAIERKLAEDRIHFMAQHDALTKLPNRSLLKDRLAQAILFANRYDHRVSVVFIDLDNFKIVNDSLGHSAGDVLLKTVAERMVACVRPTDTVVRLGGDEFVILLADQARDDDTVSLTIEALRAAIAEPVQVEDRCLRVTCSLGVATYPNDGADADTLIANADAAMYRAKEIGRDNVQHYTPELNVKIHDKFVMQEELRNAVARSEFILHYQPQIELASGRMFAVEALVRWQHPERGIVSPATFIPIAEDTGLIVPIGDWVLHEACRQAKVWQDAGLPPISVCVNISARQFREKNLICRVTGALRDSGLDARYLELELTESLIMQDVNLAVETMKALKALGVQLSIDDFGTGYSSLSALKTFPVARLKIDKSFIDDLPDSENDRAVAGAVISLGHNLNLRVIAEGVETEAQVAFLRDNHCDEVQGYHFSRPLPADEIARFMKARG